MSAQVYVGREPDYLCDLGYLGTSVAHTYTEVDPTGAVQHQSNAPKMVTTFGLLCMWHTQFKHTHYQVVRAVYSESTAP